MQARQLGQAFIPTPHSHREVWSLQRLRYGFNLSTFRQAGTFELRAALWEAIRSHFGLLATSQNKQIDYYQTHLYNIWKREGSTMKIKRGRFLNQVCKSWNFILVLQFMGLPSSSTAAYTRMYLEPRPFPKVGHAWRVILKAVWRADVWPGQGRAAVGVSA